MKWLNDLIRQWLAEWFGKKKDDTSKTPNPVECEWSHEGRGSLLVKPHAEGDGNLVVLLPARYCENDIKAVFVGGERAWKVYKSYDEGARGCKLIDGRKFGRNENATHARFQSPGEAYGRTSLRVVFKDGSEKAKVFDMSIKDSYRF